MTHHTLLLSWFTFALVVAVFGTPAHPAPAPAPPAPLPPPPPPNPCQWREPLKGPGGGPLQCSLSEATSCPRDYKCISPPDAPQPACCLAQDPDCKDTYPEPCFTKLMYAGEGTIAAKCAMVASSLNIFPEDADYIDKSSDKVGRFCRKTCALCGEPAPKTSSETYKEMSDSDPYWQAYTTKYGKDYSYNGTEGILRQKIYANNSVEVVQHNQQYEKGYCKWKMDTNRFAIWTQDERKHLLGLKFPSQALNTEQQANSGLLGRRRKRAAEQTPTAQNWTSYMGPVRDQGTCGGCWAFAMTAVVQAYRKMQQNATDQLSVQQFLECDKAISPTYGVANDGCDGGYFQIAAEYLKKQGQTTELLYPFIGQTIAVCQSTLSLVSPKISSFDMGYVTPSATKTTAQLEIDMVARLSKQPVAVGIAVSDDFFLYESGVYDAACGDTINHAVVLVGYTDEYWIIQNSWGPDWGENGYMRIKRGDDRCLMTHYWATPTALEGTSTATTTTTSATTPSSATTTVSAATTSSATTTKTATSSTTEAPVDVTTKKPTKTKSDE
uniref:Peptidase C1A papain C-terminal domain-containing protein n=1 Tax=Plectus sambesii TaxID=2011161 RepID=A0A914WV66_9BILA